MKIAYLILSHRNLNQLALLVNLLLNGNNDNFCVIHLDSDVYNESNIKILQDSISSQKYHLSKVSYKISWGGFNMVKATLQLMYEALYNMNIEFNYLSLISGMDLPIKSNDLINEYLQVNSGNQFIEYFELPNPNNWNGNGGMDRITYQWFVDEIGYNESVLLVKCQMATNLTKSLPNSVETIYGGSQWWTITVDCAKYIFDFINIHPEYYHFFNYSLIADELFFHTIIMNSNFAASVINNNLRLIDWSTGPEYPKIFTMADSDKIKKSSLLFARKFDENSDPRIIQLIQRLVS